MSAIIKYCTHFHWLSVSRLRNSRQKDSSSNTRHDIFATGRPDARCRFPLSIFVFSSAIAIARKIDPVNPEAKRVTAGKEVIRSVNKYIKEGKEFSIETTLAGKNAIKQIQSAKEMGYEITMFYIALNDVKKNIERVAMRVKNGGHHIPTEDIF